MGSSMPMFRAVSLDHSKFSGSSILQKMVIFSNLKTMKPDETAGYQPAHLDLHCVYTLSVYRTVVLKGLIMCYKSHIHCVRKMPTSGSKFGPQTTCDLWQVLHFHLAHEWLMNSCPYCLDNRTVVYRTLHAGCARIHKQLILHSDHYIHWVNGTVHRNRLPNIYHRFCEHQVQLV